jgi:hypothetical protein
MALDKLCNMHVEHDRFRTTSLQQLLDCFQQDFKGIINTKKKFERHDKLI